jgi:hypothetical protein
MTTLEVPVCCVLKGKRPKHEFDGNSIFVLVLFRFASFDFQMTPTPTANRRQPQHKEPCTCTWQKQLLLRHPLMALPDIANAV